MPAISESSLSRVMSARIRIAFADDHDIFRLGLASYCDIQSDIELIASFRNGHDLLEWLEHPSTVNLIVIDYDMERGGVELIQAIKSERPWLKVVVLTGMEIEIIQASSLRAGADGYLVKSDHISQTMADLRSIFDGLHVLEQTPFDTLSARELEIARALAAGYRPKIIADDLNISINTVRNHIRSIHVKIGQSGNYPDLIALLNQRNP